MEITVGTMTVNGNNGKSFRAFRTVVADGNSVSAGGPAKYHGLNTFAPRPLALITSPAVPAGFVEVTDRRAPPDSERNPYRYISWIWLNVAYGITSVAEKRAAEIVATKIEKVLTQAMSKVGVQVPAENGKSAWAAESVVEGGRINLTRTGARNPDNGAGMTKSRSYSTSTFASPRISP